MSNKRRTQNSGTRLPQILAVALAMASVLGPAASLGQGTMTIAFEGPAYPGAQAPEPPGYITPISSYTESGMQFWNPYGQQNLALVGQGVPGYADDGTAYLAITAGADLQFSLSPVAVFNLISFDAAN